MLSVPFVTVCNIMAASKGLREVGALLRELMSSGTELGYRLGGWRSPPGIQFSDGKQRSLNTVLSAPCPEGRAPPSRLLASSARTWGVKWESTGEWQDPA